ncbi:MAG TPA: transcription termination/antitermination NusG family protein [Candidatus Deferrimicrobiaceae bacterium]|jgi:transcriptional antiterminator RfaH
MPLSEIKWFLVKTKPLSEDRVSSRLADAGFELLFPKICKRGRRKGEVEKRPFFPTYLFVRFSLEQFRLIRYTHGVARIVAFGLEPQPVEEAIIASVRARMDDEGIVRLMRRPATWQPGQKVTIGDGPFTGIEAVFLEELPDRERVVLLLDTVSRFRVTVPKDTIQRT